MGSYAEQSVPFRVWLGSAEERLAGFGTTPRNKEALVARMEEFQVGRRGCVLVEC